MKILYTLAGNCISGCLAGQLVMPLYDEVPNSKVSSNKETSRYTDGILRISNVSVPTLTMYMPANSNEKRVAVIICPGGGYRIVAAGHEGEDVAKILAGWGIVAFVLKYRLPDDSIMLDKTIGPLQDAQRTIQMVRENAEEWNIDPSRIGIMGFSAGGHLASTASTHFKKSIITNTKGISLRPDFTILIYPVISFKENIAHAGSRLALLGDKITTENISEYSSEMQVTAETPPTFIVHARDDETVKLAHSIAYKEALEKNGVPVELWVYDHGGHGFGMNNPKTQEQWMDKLKNWLLK